MIKYRTVMRRIEKVEIDRETEKQVVFVGGSRENKSSSWGNWHDTWTEAHLFLIANAEQEVDTLQARLENAKGNLGNIKGMKPPADK